MTGCHKPELLSIADDNMDGPCIDAGILSATLASEADGDQAHDRESLEW